MAVVAVGSGGELVRRSRGIAFTGMLDMRRVVGMGRVFARVFLVMMLIMSVFRMSVFSRRLGGGRLDRRRGGIYSDSATGASLAASARSP